MNALTLLKQDHGNVEELFHRFETAAPDDVAELARVRDLVLQHLSQHAVIEEEVFYPAIRAKLGDDNAFEVLEGLEEHHVVKWTLSELKDMSPQAERFDAKVTVLIEMVRHHVEEEEGDMFPKVREAMGRKDLQALGETMEKAKGISPKRPHPKAPDTPEKDNLIAGPAAAGLDAAKATARKGVRKATGRGKS